MDQQIDFENEDQLYVIVIKMRPRGCQNITQVHCKEGPLSLKKQSSKYKDCDSINMTKVTFMLKSGI